MNGLSANILGLNENECVIIYDSKLTLKNTVGRAYKLISDFGP